MANQRFPDDPYRPDYQANEADAARRAAQYDNRLQVDPELSEGTTSGSRIAMYAVGAAILLGVVLYGLNHAANNNEASNTPPAQTTTSSSSTPSSTAPRTNTSPGTTTGSATSTPSQPSNPPAPANPAPPAPPKQ